MMIHAGSKAVRPARLLRFLALAAALCGVLFAASLVIAPPAAAEDVTIWSADLDVKTLNTAQDEFGCSESGPFNGQCANSNVLSDDDYKLHGTTYTIRRIEDDGSDLKLTLNALLPENVLDILTLNVDDTELAFEDASVSSSNKRYTWDSSPSWSSGDDVDLSITDSSGPSLVRNTSLAATDRDLFENGHRSAQAFTAGTWARVTSIGIGIGDEVDDDVEVTLHKGGASNPGDRLKRLSNPSSITENSVNVFTVPDNGIVLEASKTYFVVVKTTSSDRVAVSVTDTDSDGNDEHAGGAKNWTIDNGSSTNRPSIGTWQGSNQSMRIDVKGQVLLPPPTNPSARAVAPMRVTLEWDRTLPSLTGTIDRDDGYKIEWSADGNAPWTSLVNYTNQHGTFDIWCVCYPTRFNDDTIAPGTTRYYRIKAVDDDDESPWSDVVSVTTPGLVESDQGEFEFGAVVSTLDSFTDQKVFRFDLDANERYRFRISGGARVIVTDPFSTEVMNEVLEPNNGLKPRFTTQAEGEYQVKISHGGNLSAGRFHFILVPESEPGLSELTFGPGEGPNDVVLNTYGDTDRFGLRVQPGKAYRVRVVGRETAPILTAATPRIKRAIPPSIHTDHNMGKPWVDGVTNSVICPEHGQMSRDCEEFQAFVIDLRGLSGAQQTWHIDVSGTQRPDTRPYRVGTYAVELLELSSSQLQGVRMPLRAWFAAQPAQHDGSKRIKVRVAFSDVVDESPQNVGEHGVSVDGGEVTSVRPVDGQATGGSAERKGSRSAGGQDEGPEDREVVWELEIEPDSDGDVTVSLAAWRPCDEPGAICTADGRTLSTAISTTVRGPDEAAAPEPPDKPRNLSATASHNSVTLTWDDPCDDSITGYVILRRIPGIDPQGHFDVLVADTGTAATTYTNDTVAASTTYTYRIKAINEHGTSERSSWFHIDIPETPEGGPVVRFLSPPETISEDVTGPYYIAGDASGNEFISITTNTGFILSGGADTKIHCPIYFQRPGGNLELAPVVDGYVPTENGEQIHYRNGEPVTYNVDDSYMTMTYRTANTEGFYLRNCAAEPMDGYVSVTTYRDDDVNHLSRIRITQPSPFEITTGVVITVTDVNEGPEVTGGQSSFTISENRNLPNAVYEVSDPEGGTVTRWTVGGRDGDEFTITQEGELTFRNLPDYERPADSNRDNVYELQVRPYDGRYYGSFDVTVTVNDINERPTIITTNSSATALRQNENVTSRLYTYRATDPERSEIIWSVVGTDRRFFAIDERGQFSFDESSPPDFEQPRDSDGDNVYDVTIRARDDGSNTASLPVTVTVANDAEGVEPTITTRRPPATYRENGTSAVYTFRASEPQRGPISWSLQGTDSGAFIITGDGRGRAVLAFSSPPDYENPEDSDRQNDYELTVIVTDEDDHVDRLSFTITVTAVDEGPEVSGPPSFTINENGSLPNAVYTATDPEGSNVARWSVGGRDGGDFFITQGGTLYFRSPPDYERPADSDRDNVYEVTIQPSDGRNNGSYPVTVTVGNINEPPEIRSGSTTSFMQEENRTSRLYTYSAADPEGGTVTWLVAGPDGRLFTIDERGQFSFREENPPDFDNPADVDGDNLYNVTIEARDPEFNTASLPVTVLVTEVNEGPVITRDGNLFGSPPGTVPENQAVPQVLATYTASDPERPGVQITQWSTGGRDGGDFVMNALGQLRFRNPPDYERPADSNRDNVYEVEIRASDGQNTGTLEGVQTVTVTDVDEAPTITTTSRTAFTLQEGRTSTLYTFRATDPEGGDVSWGLSGTDSSAFTMSETGALSFTNPPDYEQPADSGRDNVYEVTIRASDGRNAGTLDVTATVTDHNEGQEPTISTRRPPATYRENGTSAVYTFRASDPQRGATITWTLEGTDKEDFTITADSSGRGVLAFRNSPDFEISEDADRDNTYELAVVATDDEGNHDRLDFTITVTDHNEGVEPTISTRRPPATYRENDTRPVYAFRASDPQRDPITWTLEGTDAQDLTLTADDSGRGALAFRNSPDFENPADADRDNVYELAVVAADDYGNTDRVDFAITVTDVNEGPVITLEGTATTSVPENTSDTKVLADYTATDPEDPTANIFRWSTAGRDGGDFVISELGELRFRSSPDYERPADNNRDNVYEVTVRASDGRVYGAHDAMVTVAQVNEAPVITTKSRTEFSLRENSTSIIHTYRATDQDEDDAIAWSLEGADGGDFAIYNGILNFRLLPDLENPVDEDEDNVYEITVVAADRAGLRDTVDAFITITDQSEGPVIAGPISHTVAENYDIAQVLGSYTATDAKDNRPVHPRWSLSGRDGGDFTINEDGELTFRNIPDYDRPADSNRDNVYEVTVRGHDSQAYGNLDVTVTVTPVNEHDPVVTGRETLSFRENTAVETRLHAYRATDGDRDTSYTWSLEGDDSDAFLIDEGVLTFSAPPDYEQPADRDEDNVYRVTVVASDGANRGTLGVTVTVTEQNEGPVVSGAPEFTINENRHLPSSAVYTARDPEAVGGVTTTIRWSVSGRDGGDFTIDRDTGVLAFRTPPDHERPADANRDNVYEVTVRAHDGRNYGDFQVTVTVEDVAEITGPAAISRTENFEGGLATYSPAGQGALDVKPSWRLTGADSGDFTIDRESGELTFRSIPDHERPADSNRDNVYSFAVSVSDGSYHGTLDVTVTVTAVNEPPAITGRESLSFRENTPVTTRLHTYRATDPEGDGFTWRLGGLDASDFNITPDSSGRGVLTFSSPPNFDSPGGSGAHGNQYLVTVQARDAQGDIGEFPVTVTVTDQNEGAVVTGRHTIAVRENRDPTLTLHTYLASDPEGQPITRWSLSGRDGGDFLISEGGELTFRNTPDYDRPADSDRDNEYLVTVRAYDGRTYGNLDVTITVSNVNEHGPVIRSGSRTSFTYREEGTAALYTYRATDGDKDDTITWTTEGTDGGDFTIDGDTGELTFREPPDYEAPGDSGRDNQYNLTVVATDSGRQSASLDVTVTVTAVDEGPEVSGATTYTVPEGQELAGATFIARDPEDVGAAVTSWRLAGSDAGDFTINDTGPNSAQLTFRNTPDYDRPADSNRDNEYLVTIRAYNGSTYGSLDVTVTVTDRNEAEPVVTGRDTLSFRENTATTTRLHTYRATDTDRDAELTWSVEGADGNDFTISTGGELFFRSIPDHEQAADSGSDNVYEITVVASDGTNRGTMAVTVTVTDVNEGPEITGTQSLSFAENTASDRVLATYAATDPEDPDLEITRWSVTGPDGGDFAINEEGDLTFRNPPDHERPADSGRDNVYEVTVRASDGRVYGAHDVTVTVEAVDEAPEFRSGSRDSFSYRENGTAALYTYRATDPEGAEVAWSVSGADGGDFKISDSGVLNFREPPDHDDPADDGHNNEYEVTVVATDQTGRAANLPVTVTVTDVNEGPVIADTGTNTAIMVQENHDEVLATYTATDPEDQPVTRWSVTGRDGGDFTINEGGELTFRNLPDHERPADSNRDSIYEVTVRASDGRYYGTLDVLVTVEAVDEAPEFQRNTQDSFVYPENGASAIDTYRATDPEGSAVAWDLSGTDSSAFSIGKTGVLTFNSPPDYEDPADTDDDNVYEVVVQATDDGNNTTPLDVTVTVTNLTDARAVIRGTAQVGRTLTAETSGIPDKDRSDKVDFSYQWLGDDKDIEGATDSTYEITEKDEGKTIRVRVGFSDDRGNDEALTSAATGAVAARPAQLTATFPASPFQSSRHKGDDDRPQVIVAFNLPVQSFDKTTPSVSLTGATVSSLVRHEEDGLENAWVLFLDPEGNDEIVFTLVAGQSCDVGGICTGEGKMLSEGGTTTLPGPEEEDKPDNTDSNEPDSPATGLPTINGTAQVGETLTANTSGVADADGLSNVQYEYQWLADDADISGATNATYTLVAEDEGKAITVQVGFSDDADNEETLTSAATDAVAGAQPTEPPDEPTGLDATAWHDSVTLTWDDPGDDTITGYVILRRVPGVDPEGHFNVLVADTATTATTYTDDTVAAETRYTYRIKAINGAGTSERSRWSHIDTPAAPVPDKPTGLEAAESDGQVVLTWDDPGDDSITGYVILRRVRENDTGGDFSVLVADTGTAATTYTDDTVSGGTTYTYRIKAINEHGVSERSRWVHIDTPAAP